jgi:hypothetical protein
MTQFGDGAARLSHAAALLLGWRPDDFWNATPAELAAALMPPSERSESVTFDELLRRFPNESLKHG